MDFSQPSSVPVGAYRRTIRLDVGEGVVFAAMEDDVHHFEVRVDHDAEAVRRVEAKAIRTPYVSCPGAVDHLRLLEGMTLEAVSTLASAARAEHCMHLFDLAVLAATRAAQTGFVREYRIEVDHDAQPPRARIWRDGGEALSWQIENGAIIGSQYDGLRFPELGPRLAGLSQDEAETALVLRRASLISFVRRLDLDSYPDGASMGQGNATCFAKQPVRLAEARRAYGNTRDFWSSDAWPSAKLVAEEGIN